MTDETADTHVETPDRKLLRMPIFVTPLEADILTWFELVAKRDDEGRLRIGCPADPEALHACWASDSLGCTPDEYAEALQRYVDSGIIREIAHSDETGRTTYVMAVEPNDLRPIPIKRRGWTWLDPTVHAALEAIQQTFQARFAGVIPPTREQVANRLGSMPPLDESDRVKDALFGSFLSEKEPADGAKTVWGVFAHDGEEMRFMPCNPHFMAYRFACGNPHDGTTPDDREAPTFDKVDPNAVPHFDGTAGDDRFLFVAAGDGLSTMVIRRPIPISTLFETCEATAILRACRDDDLEPLARTIDDMLGRIADERERRSKLSELRGQLDAAEKDERRARERRESLEREIAELEA